MTMHDDEKWMLKAVRLSRRFAGTTHPNPPVGCVLVRDGVPVGVGVHRGPGKPHAETEAIRSCSSKLLQGATCYVTLEPCNHWGRTPPCVDAIIDSGMTRVVIAVSDFNPSVTGGGAAKLKSAGLEVTTGVMASAAMDVLAPWMTWITTGKPFVVLKSAMSADGHVATCSGESRWISGSKSRGMVHRLRARMGAIMVGAGTVRQDNPRLTARKKGKTVAYPTRIVIDPSADIPENSHVLQPDLPGRTLWIVSEQCYRSNTNRETSSVSMIPCPERDDGLDLEHLMLYLGQQESIGSILLEGGPTLSFSMIEQNLVHKVMLFIAPMLIGGRRAPAVLGGSGFPLLDSAPRLQRVSVRKMGEDFLLEGYLGDWSCLLASSRKSE